MLTESQIDELKTKNPGAELSVLENDEFETTLVVKTPSPGDYQGWRALQETNNDVFAVNRGFAVNHVVFPSAAEVMEKFKRRPGLVEAVVRNLVKLAGARAEFTVKKL